jgi:hypothetical protein
MSPYNYSLGTELSNNSNRNTTTQTNTVEYGRVVSVVLDKGSDDYKIFGGPDSIGGVRYRRIGVFKDEDFSQDLPFAYPLNVESNYLPVVGEIIRIQNRPIESSIIQSTKKNRNFYTGVVNIFSEINNNRYLDEFQVNVDTFVDELAPEATGIFRLSPQPGDFILQGRLGSTIRLGGYLNKNSPLFSEDTSNNPYALYRIGKGIPDGESLTTYEDINTDDASIYFLSNHKVNLKTSTNKTSTYKTLPTGVKEYKGKQLVLNSDRIVLNSKVDSILVSSAKSFGVGANTINLESTEYVGLEGRKIFLGAKSVKAEKPEPIILGLQNEKFMEVLISSIDTLSKTLISLQPSPAAAIAQLQSTGTILQSYILSLKTLLPTIKSKKVFTDSNALP